MVDVVKVRGFYFTCCHLLLACHFSQKTFHLMAIDQVIGRKWHGLLEKNDHFIFVHGVIGI